MWSQLCSRLEDTSKEVKEIIKNSINTFKGIDGNFYYCVEENNTKHFYRGEEKHYIIGMEYVDEIHKIETYPISYKKFLQMWKQSK